MPLPSRIAAAGCALALIACAVEPTPDGVTGATGSAGGDGSATSSAATGAGGGATTGGGEPFPDVARVPAPAGYTPNGDGTYSLGDGMEVFDATRALYETLGDHYDFVIVWTDFRVAGVWQYEITTRVDIQGIGQDTVYQQYYGWPLDWYVEAGSAGKLQAVVFMNDRTIWDAAAYTVQDILTHEVGHRWGAGLLLPWEADPTWVLDASVAHYTLAAGLGGPGALSYGQTVDLGGGAFRSETVKPLAYSPFELYTMGLLPPGDPLLADLFYVESLSGFAPAVDPIGAPWTADSVNGTGTVEFQGQRVDLPMSDVVQALGPRVPASADAQKAFRFAFVLLCEPGQACRDDTIAWVDEQRIAWETRFGVATGGRATAGTKL